MKSGLEGGWASSGWGRAEIAHKQICLRGEKGGSGSSGFLVSLIFFFLLPELQGSRRPGGGGGDVPWVCKGLQWGRSSWISDLGFTGVGVSFIFFSSFFFWVAVEEDEDGGEKMKVLGFGGCGEKRGFHFFLFIFLIYIYLEDLGFF